MNTVCGVGTQHSVINDMHGEEPFTQTHVCKFSRATLVAARVLSRSHISIHPIFALQCTRTGSISCRSVPFGAEQLWASRALHGPKCNLLDLVGPWCPLCCSVRCAHSPWLIELGCDFAWFYPENVLVCPFVPTASRIDIGACGPLKFFSQNCMSLSDRGVDHDGAGAGGVEFFSGSPVHGVFSGLGVYVAGLQEAWLPQGSLGADDYFLVSSGAAVGSGRRLGCVLWFSKRIPWIVKVSGQSKKFFNDLKWISIVFSEPRMLVVTLSSPMGPFLFCVLHGPDASDTALVASEWWDGATTKVRSALGPIRRSWHGSGPPIIAFCDVNGRLGSVRSQWVGAWNSDTQDSCGECFHGFCAALDLFVPSTFNHFGACAKPTFFHHSGSSHRIDFFAVSSHFWSPRIACLGRLGL